MKVVIVNCFDTYEDRVDLVHEFFEGKGNEVTVVQSDFEHSKKVHRKESKEKFIFVKTNPYYKNLSIARLSSHYKYAIDAFKVVEDIKPDILYTFVPPNSLVKYAASYKKVHKEVKLILDLIDLWPETMPIGKAKKFPPFTFWGAMRDKNLKYADLIITECNLYQTVLGDLLKNIKTETVYLAKKKIDVISKPQLDEDEINLAYLGSINNIIDIPMIKEIIEVMKSVKPIRFHIIGDGESKQELIDAVNTAGAIVEYHGKIYDPKEKQEIFDRCHFGLNIMKKNVCVGLTMKSIDYYQHGLPIINNIPADTAEIVEKYGVGININNKPNFNTALYNNLDLRKDVLLSMKERSFALYNELFSTEAFFIKLETLYKELIG